MNYNFVRNKDCYAVDSLQKVLDIRPNKFINQFVVPVTFCGLEPYTDLASGYIDSGASNTIITALALFKGNVEEKLLKIRLAVNEQNITTKKFSLARGTEDMLAYYCVLPIVKIGSFNFSNFPFYLVDNAVKASTLIGFDFLTSCDFVQCQNGNLNVYNFDIEMMRFKMHGDNPLYLNQLDLS